MEGVSIIRSFQVGTNARGQAFLEKPLSRNASLYNLAFPLASGAGGRLIYSLRIHNRSLISCVKASEDASEKITGSVKKNTKNSTFPNGFETLVLDVCDETDIAELKLKVGGFEMHLRRNVGAPRSPPHIVSPTTAPPIPSEPMAQSIPAAPSGTPQRPPQVPTSPFSNASSVKATKLAALEASGIKTYALVSSPTVGSFRSGRTIKGRKQPPSFKEGDLIDEGQIIGYLDQFGNELPVKSDVAGEVLKILCKDGDAVGYGDPLVAVLPSFHSTIL